MKLLSITTLRYIQVIDVAFALASVAQKSWFYTLNRSKEYEMQVADNLHDDKSTKPNTERV